MDRKDNIRDSNNKEIKHTMWEIVFHMKTLALNDHRSKPIYLQLQSKNDKPSKSETKWCLYLNIDQSHDFWKNSVQNLFSCHL